MAAKPQFKLQPKTQTLHADDKPLAPRLTADDIEQLMEMPAGSFYRPVKKQISIRLDADVLAWFQAQPGKYQTLINRACRIFMRLQTFLSKT